MANLSVDGLDGLALSLADLAELPDAVLDEMLLAEGRVIQAAQKQSGEAYHIRRTGKMLAAIAPAKVRKTSGGRSLSVYAQGQHGRGKPSAMVAFLNEYGRKGQSPRPFIRDANEQSAGKAVDAAEAVYDNYLQSKGLK
ncbi:hypothetical protein D3Z48_09020 [Clostridiaceae bacterium]|nr:hypothetical protein [Clostridiaceae bacterium]